MLVALSKGTSYAATSQDHGVTWTLDTIPNGQWEYIGVDNVNGKLVAFSSAGADIGNVITSNDGKVWTLRTGVVPTGAYWRAVVSNGTKFVAVNSNNANVISSTDGGLSWTTHTGALPATTGWYSIAWNGTTFVAQRSPKNPNTANDIATSTDGITWVGQCVVDSTTAGWRVYWTGQEFVTTGAGYSAYTSTTGAAGSWTYHSLADNRASDSLAADGAGRMMLTPPLGSAYTHVHRSNNRGVTWGLAAPMPYGYVNWRMVYDGTYYFAVTSGVALSYAKSTDGAAWTQGSVYNATVRNWNALALFTYVAPVVGPATGGVACALPLSAAATGLAGMVGVAAATVILSVAGIGEAPPSGGVSVPVTLSAQGVAIARPIGGVSGSPSFSCTAAGFVAPIGAATAQFSFSTAAQGLRGSSAVVACVVPLNTSASATHGRVSHAAVPVQFGVAATGAQGIGGSAQTALCVVASASAVFAGSVSGVCEAPLSFVVEAAGAHTRPYEHAPDEVLVVVQKTQGVVLHG